VLVRCASWRGGTCCEARCSSQSLSAGQALLHARRVERLSSPPLRRPKQAHAHAPWRRRRAVPWRPWPRHSRPGPDALPSCAPVGFYLLCAPPAQQLLEAVVGPRVLGQHMDLHRACTLHRAQQACQDKVRQQSKT
jgi:hypothetical protein